MDREEVKAGGLFYPIMCQGSSQLLVFHGAGMLQQRPTWSGQLESETHADEHSVSLWPFCVRSFSETSYFL